MLEVSFLDLFSLGCAGFSSGKAETQSSDLSETCGTVQGDKVTAFRPVMKRWSRWESALKWKKNQWSHDTHIQLFTHKEKRQGKTSNTHKNALTLSLFVYMLLIFIRLVSNIIHKLGQKYFSSSYAQLLFGNVSYHKVFFLLFCAFISIPAVLPPRSLEIYHSNYWDIYYALNDTPAN